MLHTACGDIEFAESGPADAPAVLLVHGSGGGFDQGLAIGQSLAPRGVRLIAPSRFGYLRSPFPADPSGERQADHLACLLDALGLADAAVMGVSAGAVSALHFAVRHPQRTRALLLVVPAVYRPDPAVPMPAWALASAGCRPRRRPAVVAAGASGAVDRPPAGAGDAARSLCLRRGLTSSAVPTRCSRRSSR